jgi:NodT family efflux transporter outer membrane factor (OMF) lipoprotein
LIFDNYSLTLSNTKRNRPARLWSYLNGMKKSYLLLSSALLVACASVPSSGLKLAGEPVEIFAVAPDAPEAWAASGVAGEPPTGDWTQQFDDPLMVALIEEALANSPTLEARAATVRAAAASTRIARSSRRPTVSASGTLGGTSNGFELGGQTERQTDPLFGLGLDARWEIDLWNRLGSAVSEAESDLVASEADFAAAELSIAAQTAIAWINLNAALAQERVAVQTFEARNRVKLLTERRFQSGLTNALDVRTARSALAGAEAAIAARQQTSGDASRRLEILLGRYPAAELAGDADISALDDIINEGNPALLLSRRPDIAAQEARVMSAGLRAEQARLAMLPSLNLSGTLSTNSTDFAEAFDPALIAARLIGNLVQPLYNGGRLDAQRDAAIAQAEVAVANYAASVLTAWREVEDALSADSLLAVQEDAQLRALEEARLAEELAERSYTSGTSTIFNLIDSQTRRLNAESQLVSARANRATNRISYHLALGGSVPVAPADRIVAGDAETAPPPSPDLPSPDEEDAA